MISKMSSIVVLVTAVTGGAGSVWAAPAGGLDFQQQRITAAEQVVAENAYRWQRQEQYRLQQEQSAARQAAEDAKQLRLRERIRERNQDRSGFFASGSNTGSMVGARMGGKGGH